MNVRPGFFDTCERRARSRTSISHNTAIPVSSSRSRSLCLRYPIDKSCDLLQLKNAQAGSDSLLKEHSSGYVWVLDFSEYSTI